MANEEIRKAVAEAKLKLWQVAARYGCNDSNFSRHLRFELSPKEKSRIRKIIKELAGTNCFGNSDQS